MRQHAVTDQEAKPAGIEELLVHVGNVVDDSGEAKSIVRPAPLLALERQPGGDGAVDVGDVEWFDTAVGPASAHEDAKIGRYFLLDIHAQPAAALVFAHCCDIGWPASDLREIDRILEAAHVAPAEKSGNGDLAGMSP